MMFKKVIETIEKYDFDPRQFRNHCRRKQRWAVMQAFRRSAKAYVQNWGGPADGGDTRYIWTAVERAT